MTSDLSLYVTGNPAVCADYCNVSLYWLVFQFFQLLVTLPSSIISVTVTYNQTLCDCQIGRVGCQFNPIVNCHEHVDIYIVYFRTETGVRGFDG